MAAKMLKKLLIAAMAASFSSLAACAGGAAPDAPLTVQIDNAAIGEYLVGPGDTVQVFVWRSPELSTTVRVRPDGRISVPLIEDLEVAGRSPSAISRAVERRLAEFVVDPKVTVIIQDFVGQADRQIRVVGAAVKPQAIPYRKDMTVLDVLIASGGLTPFADGNGAVIVRRAGNGSSQYRVRLTDLMREADMGANAQVAPGDVLMIPQRWF